MVTKYEKIYIAYPQIASHLVAKKIHQETRCTQTHKLNAIIIEAQLIQIMRQRSGIKGINRIIN